MSFVYRYTGSDQDLTVRSDVRRYDLEEWACWERVSEAEVKPAKAEPVAVEAEQPVVEDKPAEAPKRRTRRKPAGTEVED
ncbi:hypothetical protein ACQR3W_22030 [Rhodococcus ruber]|uniref:Uncharacterized protein n=1 Tax=Rhodococcus ruber TaxID=1830 RepID=A0A098BLC9_9NOCA|nr:hypothetical protein [Rhodococcus ruber]MCZ4505928.1 hypothetical protein [Rhodococcus ruber]MCZ4533471.1 hypothetical protein [Rhodococcus ruber]CDZ89050.1 conserved hypothetical protein [Rhodococcus ruber]